MASVFQESNQGLSLLWKQHNQDEDEYLGKEKVVEWVKAALEQTNTLENVKDSLTDIEGLIKQYLEEVHEANEENLQNVALSYPEGIDFLKWLTNSDTQQPAKKEEEEPVKKEEEQEKVEEGGEDIENGSNKQELPEEDKQNQSNLGNSKAEELKRSSHDINLQLSSSSPKIKNNSSVRLSNKQIQSLVHMKNSSQITSLPQKLKTQKQEQREYINQNITVSPTEFNLETISRKYRDYLKIVFEHYCKASYATGQDPTFQQIQHKTTIMTINKFMMFCKDFDIGKISKSFNLAFLVEIFKKNSECYKEMSFEQFDEVVTKIAIIGFADDSEQRQQRQETNLISTQMVKMLQFLGLSTSRRFRQKIQRLNIHYRAGRKTNAEMKMIPDGYKFKYTATNGKNEEQVKQEIEERRQHRSEKKILMHEKVSASGGNRGNQEVQARRRTQSKRTDRLVLNRDKPLASIKEGAGYVQSTNALLKVLTPPIPPSKRTSYLPPQPQKATSNTPSVSNANLVSVSIANTNNVFKKDLGYAELHKMKQSEGYSRQLSVLNQSSNRDEKQTFKLNSIVEEARMEVMQANRQTQVKEAYSDLTDSIATNSREQTNRSKNYDVNRINSKMQILNQKLQRDRQIQQDLTGILDISNDEDQFLKQHLQRQLKNQSMNKRISQRIQASQK